MPQIPSYAEKTVLADDDLFVIADSAAANATKKVKAKNVTPFRTIKIHLTSAQIQTGNSVPIVLVPAAGSGTAIYVWHDTTARCINGAVPAIAVEMSIRSNTSSKSQILFATGFLSSVTNNPIKGDDIAGVDDATTILENKDLIVLFDADNPAFDGTIDIYLKYEIIQL